MGGVRDLRETWSWIQRLIPRIERLESGAFLERSSITDGVMTFIRGRLLLEGGALLQGEGRFEWAGPGSVAGDFEVLGGGRLRVGGIVLTPQGDGSILVGTGIRILASGGGEGRIEVGRGDAVVSLDSSYSSPRINLGAAQIESATGEAFTFTMGTNVVYFVNGTIRLPGLATPPAGTSTRYVVADALGNLYAAPAGGPTPGDGGDPGSPGEPGDNPAGYVYPIDPSRWSVSNTYAQHLARSSQEPGIDWAASWGTPVWAPGDGTIVDVKPTNSDATGRYVTLVTAAGDWFRFLHLSSFPVSVGQTVSRGDVIGYTGGSGRGSDSGYGLHLHVSFKRGYTGSGWPGATALDDLLAYMSEAA